MTKPATDRLKLNPPLGMMPALQYLLPVQLNIDDSYQRSLDTDASKTLVRSIAQDPASEIGSAISHLIIEAGWARAAIRFSGQPSGLYAARVLDPGETDPDAILCPAQTGATDCCATCALCWHSPKSIAFRKH